MKNLMAQNTMIDKNGKMETAIKYYQDMYKQWDSKPVSILLVRTHK